jgi:hypothetical protein
MQIEFFTPAPGIFNATTYFREPNSSEYKPIEALDLNKQNILFHLFLNDTRIHKYIIHLRSTGIVSVTDIVTKCIVRFFSKLDKVWDIDENNLNIEIQ